MADIKKKDSVKGTIKTIDKAAIAAVIKAAVKTTIAAVKAIIAGTKALIAAFARYGC